MACSPIPLVLVPLVWCLVIASLLMVVCRWRPFPTKMWANVNEGSNPWSATMGACGSSLVLLHHIHDGHPMALQCCAHRLLLGSHNLDKSMAAGGPGLWKAMGRPHASSPIHSPWFGAPCSGTCPASSWGGSGCKTFPMAVSAGGWNGFGKHTVLAWCYNIAYKTLIL